MSRDPILSQVDIFIKKEKGGNLLTVFKVQLLLPITMYQIIELTKCSSDTFRSQELLSFVDQEKMTQNPGDGSMTTLQ